MVYSIAVSVVLLALLLYFDWRHRQEIQQKDQFIKDLELKFISRNVGEYKIAVSDEPEEEEVEESPYVELDDVPLDDLLRAEDKL